MIAAGLVQASFSCARREAYFVTVQRRRTVWRPSGQEDDLVALATQQFQVAAGRRAGQLYRLLAAAGCGVTTLVQPWRDRSQHPAARYDRASGGSR